MILIRGEKNTKTKKNKKKKQIREKLKREKC